jgi:hypothetical protein
MDLQIYSHIIMTTIKIGKKSQAPVAHAYNPSYSGGRDQEGHNLKPAWGNNSQDPNLEKTHPQKRAGGMA